MTSTDIAAIAADKASDLLQRTSQADAWAACASIWGRLYVLAAPGWRKWDRFLTVVNEAMLTSLQVSVTAQGSDEVRPPRDLLIAKLEAFDIEDDGSAEWQYVVDLAALLSMTLDSRDVGVFLQPSLQTYLEGVFNVLANRLALANKRSVSRLEVKNWLSADDEWARTINFVTSL